MWRVGAALGLLVWLVTITASAMINFLAGAQYGRTREEEWVFALLGVSADIWKAVGPLFIVALWRGQRRVSALLATVVWLICLSIAVAAALGLVAQIRSAKVTRAQGVISDFSAVERELADIDRKRATRTNIRSTGEIAAAIEQVLSRSAGRGTVGNVSEACSRDYARTRQACGEVATLRVEHAVATERERLDARAEQLRTELSQLRSRGGTQHAADPQAALIERLTVGWLPAAEVGLALTLLVGAMIELVSAFAPLVVQEYVAIKIVRNGSVARTDGNARKRRQRRKKRPAGNRQDVYDYLARRVRPDEVGRVTAGWLFADYAMWCADAGRKPIKRGTFHALVDEIAHSDLEGKVARRGDVYHGLALGEDAAEAAE